MSYYCTRETGRKDSNGNKEQCGVAFVSMVISLFTK